MDIKQELIINVAQKYFNSYGIKYTSIEVYGKDKNKENKEIDYKESVLS
jgi:hypothetical protein